MAKGTRRRVWVLLGLLLVGGLGYAERANRQSHRPVATVLPPADAEPGRWVILDGANNTRDLGGYRTQDGRRVRWKTVYRSGTLSGLTPSGGEAFRKLGVRRVIDFRHRLAASSLFGGDASSVFRTARVTVLAIHAVKGDSTTSAYVLSVRQDSDSYRQAFELLADPANRPLLFHCLAGKDRTGTMAALLLTLLGVDHESVMKDYALSELAGQSVNRQAMNDLLDEVARQGGIDNYLTAIGVSAATRQAIRDALLE